MPSDFILFNLSIERGMPRLFCFMIPAIRFFVLLTTVVFFVSCAGIQAPPRVALSKRVPSGEKHKEESHVPLWNSSGVATTPSSVMRTLAR